MIKPIKIGEKLDGSALALNLDTLLRTRLLLQASSGAGKTEALRLLCEKLSPKVPVHVIDPEGEFAPLRAIRPFVLAGPGGETPALPRSAPLLAHRLLELGASAIMDIYELPAHQRHEFVRDYLAALIDAPKKLWRPLIVIVDEAHVYAPEKGMGESVALQAMADLASRGRKRGFCAILATQRLAKLSKNVAAECQNIMIGRTTQIDQARALDLLNITGKGGRDSLAKSLGQLAVGNFFCYGVAFDSADPEMAEMQRAESAPMPGVANKYLAPPTPDAIKDLLPKLSDLPAEAEAKARTEADLRKEIAELKKQIKQQPQATAISPEREKMLLQQINTLEDNLAKTKKAAVIYEKAMRSIYAETDSIMGAIIHIKKIVDETQRDISAAAIIAPKEMELPKLNPRKMELKPVPPSYPGEGGMKLGSGLSSPEQRILDAIAWFESIGISEPQNAAVAFMAGYVPGGGAYNNPKSKLRGAGLIESSSDTLRLTADGKLKAAIPRHDLTNEALHAKVLARLDGPMRRILIPLITAYPSGMNREELAAAAQYEPNGGAFNNPVSRLRSLGLIRTAAGQNYAADILFPEK